jgi:uncharacterized protein with HEPN domain
MNVQERDRSILEHILSYCDQIEMAVARFGRSYATFDSDPVYRNAVSLCILQIGELVGHLSDSFKETHSQIPWRQIKLMRNIVAHRYGTVDNTITWDVIEHDIPELKAYCSALLRCPQT